jgi:hypothetical protein
MFPFPKDPPIDRLYKKLYISFFTRFSDVPQAANTT